MRKFNAVIGFILCSTHSFAQHAYVALSNDAYNYPTTYFACGSEAKLRFHDGSKIKGVLDTVFADAVVISGDTFLFSSIEKYSYKYQNRKKAKKHFFIGVGMVGGGFILIGTYLLASVSHQESGMALADAALSIGASSILIGIPVLISGIFKEYVWRGKRLSGHWHINAVLS